MSASNLAVHIETQHANISSKYIKNIIFGGLDGIITTFSIIAAAYGADFSTRLIIIMGTANLLADAVSMGLGEYISSVSENIYINTERNKEEHEYEHNKEYEVKEMVALYKGKGLNEQDAQSVVNILAKPNTRNSLLKIWLPMNWGWKFPRKITRKSIGRRVWWLLYPLLASDSSRCFRIYFSILQIIHIRTLCLLLIAFSHWWLCFVLDTRRPK